MLNDSASFLFNLPTDISKIRKKINKILYKICFLKLSVLFSISMAESKIISNAISINYHLMGSLCLKNGAQLNVVSKFCLSNSDIINFLFNDSDFPCRIISDSNMSNFSLLNKELAQSLTKCVIKTRISDIKKIPSLPEYVRPDRVFISDMELLKEIEKLPSEMQPEIVLITETGDMKDGFMPAQIMEICNCFENLKIIGISVNFACLSGILPDVETVKKLAELAGKVQEVRKLETPFLSVGGTVIQSIAQNGELKGLIQEIRSGEGIFFGYDSSSGHCLDKFSQETIILSGEILEVSEKDFSIRNGRKIGFSATGAHSSESETNKYEVGVRKRAVLDFGVLAANQKDLIPKDSAIQIVGQTFDFTVVDITDSKQDYSPGGGIDFITNYASASFTMMNRYISCVLAEE